MNSLGEYLNRWTTSGDEQALATVAWWVLLGYVGSPRVSGAAPAKELARFRHIMAALSSVAAGMDLKHPPWDVEIDRRGARQILGRLLRPRAGAGNPGSPLALHVDAVILGVCEWSGKKNRGELARDYERLADSLLPKLAARLGFDEKADSECWDVQSVARRHRDLRRQLDGKKRTRSASKKGPKPRKTR